MLKNKRVYGITVIFFLIVILIGTSILKLAICTKKEFSYIDLLFETTSGVSGTGFSLMNISEDFTKIGQFILILLVQLGSIGFMLFFSLLFIANKKKIRLTDLIVWGNETNVDNYNLLKDKSISVFKYTFFIEFFGALFLCFKFIPLYGLKNGIWISIFHSISAFCNAGFDIIGNNSFYIFQNDIYINIVLIVLMFLGGIGFFVLDDFIQYFISRRKNKLHSQTKLILLTTACIIVIGMVIFKIYESSATILQSLFTIVSARNTGFFTIPIENLSDINLFLLTAIMFIGGGPASNAGGIKVSVFAILIFTTIANIQNEEETIVFYKTINDKLIKKAVMIFNVDLLIVIVGMMIIAWNEKISGIDSIFYVTSLFSNTGLNTFDITKISVFGKCVSIFIMYLGRIAPMTFLSLLLPTHKKDSGIKYPNIDIML